MTRSTPGFATKACLAVLAALPLAVQAESPIPTRVDGPSAVGGPAPPMATVRDGHFEQRRPDEATDWDGLVTLVISYLDDLAQAGPAETVALEPRP